MSSAPALLLVDLQNAIDDPRWRRHGDRNNPDAESVVNALLALWRRKGFPVYHIRHDSTEPESPYLPGQPGHAFKADNAP